MVPITPENDQKTLVDDTSVTISWLWGGVSFDSFKTLFSRSRLAKIVVLLFFWYGFFSSWISWIEIKNANVSPFLHLLITIVPFLNICILQWNTIEHGERCWRRNKFSFEAIYIWFILFLVSFYIENNFHHHSLIDIVLQVLHIQLFFEIQWINLFQIFDHELCFIFLIWIIVTSVFKLSIINLFGLLLIILFFLLWI